MIYKCIDICIHECIRAVYTMQTERQTDRHTLSIEITYMVGIELQHMWQNMQLHMTIPTAVKHTNMMAIGSKNSDPMEIGTTSNGNQAPKQHQPQKLYDSSCSTPSRPGPGTLLLATKTSK